MAHVFISYQHDDVDFAENLKHRVEKAGFEVWMDSDRLSAGEDWREGIDQGIKTASALLVVMTPGAKASEYVTYEWAFAWGAGVPVIPIMLKPTPLHPRLEALQYLDFTNRARPWDRLLARLETISKQPNATPKLAEQTSTIRVPDDAPPYFKQAVTGLDSASVTERKDAIHTLARINLPDARRALVAALDHPLWDVALEAALQLAFLQDHRAVPILLRDIAMTGASVAGAGQLGIWKLGNTAIPSLISMLSNGSEFINAHISFGSSPVSVAQVSAYALESINTPEALAAAEKWRKQRGGAKTESSNQ